VLGKPGLGFSFFVVENVVVVICAGKAWSTRISTIRILCRVMRVFQASHGEGKRERERERGGGGAEGGGGGGGEGRESVCVRENRCH
jgi:hypothetical protein